MRIDLSDKGITVIGVSADDVPHRRLSRKKYHFPFTLLADHRPHGLSQASAFRVPRGSSGWSLRVTAVFSDQKGGPDVWRDLKAPTRSRRPTF